MIDWDKELSKYQSLVEEYNKETVFCALTMSLYMDEPLTREFISDYVTDGSNDKKTDFLAITQDGDNTKHIYLAQSTYSAKKSKESAKANKASDLNTALSWMFSGNKSFVPEKLGVLMEDCITAINNSEVIEFHVLYTHNMPESIDVTLELNTIQNDLERRLEGKNVHVFAKELGTESLEKLYKNKRDNIRIFDDIEFPFDLGFSQNSNDWNAEISVVDGKWLKLLYSKYGEELFSSNYRGFLGASAKKKINNQIKSTAENTPKDFWAYNNGITILTNSIQKNGKKILLTGITIINGAQTTGCIGNLSEKLPLEEIKVLCKIISCNNPNKSSDIVKYTNTQNAITTWDRYSNDPHQQELKKQLENFDISYSLKRGSDVSSCDMGIETIALPLLAFRGNFYGAYAGKNNIFNKKELYNFAFDYSKGRHLILIEAISRCFDNYKKNVKSSLSADAPKRKHDIYNLLSEIGFKAFYLYMFGELIEDIYDKKCDRKSVAIDNNTVNTFSLIEISAMFTGLTEKLVMSISNAFYRNNNSLRYREVIREEKLFEAWINDSKDYFTMQLDEISDIDKVRKILSIS